LDLADQAYLLETGRIVFSGTPDAIRKNDSIRRAYLGNS
jgi:branched-chain amino acid transport system ATP-binding protein